VKAQQTQPPCCASRFLRIDQKCNQVIPWSLHVVALLCSLHWLLVPERISFRLAVLVYRCLHGSAPGYLASDLQRVSDLSARRRLCSSTTSALVAPRTVRATIGDRAFPAAAASVWNSLPETVRSSSSLPVFRSRLKTELFARSYSCSD